MQKNQVRNIGIFVGIVLGLSFFVIGGFALAQEKKPSIVINNGDKLTKQRRVTLDIQGPYKTEKMKVVNGSKSALADAPWVKYDDKKDNWTLTGPNGKKTVYVQFLDFEGEISSVYSDSIDMELDDDPGFYFNDGEDVVTNRKVTLVIFPPSNAKKMRISNNSYLLDKSWESLKDTKKWTLTEGRGKKTVWIQYQKAGSEPGQIHHESVFLDVPDDPVAEFSINKGAEETDSRLVTLSLSKVKGYESMRVANGSSYAPDDWQSIPSSLKWILPAKKGKKTISIQFKDVDGKTKTVKESITYTAPENIIEPGTVLKDSASKLYYLGFDKVLHPFTHPSVYHSWYQDFDDVVQVSKQTMKQFAIGTPMCVRPGTWLLKFGGGSTLYTVEHGCTIRPVRSDAEAHVLFGPSWPRRVMVLDGVHANYYTVTSLSAANPSLDIADKDADGVDANTEALNGSSDTSKDTDGDGVSDYEEIFYWDSDPAKKDSDSDGFSDGQEIIGGFTPTGSGQLNDAPAGYLPSAGAVVYQPGEKKYYYQHSNGHSYYVSTKTTSGAFKNNRFSGFFAVQPKINMSFTSVPKGTLPSETPEAVRPLVKKNGQLLGL